jgi:predicted O-linked N-acetylglucosamine transferase (SPINDLY family)
VTYLGYPDTTGLSCIDHRIVDAICDPPGLTDPYCTEKLIRLDGPFVCYRPDDASPPVSEPPCLKSGYVPFGSFNNFSKINDVVLQTWAEILRNVPNSRIVLKWKAADEYRRRVIAQFAGLGIDAARVHLPQPDISREAHLQSYGQMDIALDTFPYCGTMTTCEALWMGVPVITLAGQTHASRVGTSLLTHVGLTDLIAADRDRYIQIAARLARATAELQQLRSDMRRRLLASSLCDQAGFVSRIEGAYRDIWSNHLASGK